MSKSNETIPNVPTLRFKSFEQEWEYSTIGKCSISLEYGMNAAAKTYDGKHKYIRITDINEETSAFDPNPLSSPDGEYKEKYLVKENDILFARTGASVGKSYLYNTKDGELYFAGFVIRARIKPVYNGAFIYYQTKSKKYEKWINLTSMRSGQPGINSQEYSSYTIGMTSRTEQDKIADFLLGLDRKIAVQNKIIEDLKCQIKWIRYKIFSYSKNIKKDNKTTMQKEYLLNLSNYENCKKDKIYKAGSILLQKSATNGEVIYLETDSPVEDKYIIITANKEIDSRYLYYVIKENIKKFLYKYQDGMNLKPELLKYMKFYYEPDKNKQKIISYLDSCLDSCLDSHLDLINKYKDMKKYFLKNMFC